MTDEITPELFAHLVELAALELNAQEAEYLRRQLRAYKRQTAADLDGTMTMAAQPLAEADIEALAHYLARLIPAR